MVIKSSLLLLAVLIPLSAMAQFSPIGFMRRRTPPATITTELGGYALTTLDATRGTTHQDGQNLAYVGIGFSRNASSRSFTDFRWDGVTGDLALGAVTNAGSEHGGVAIGLLNASSADWTKTMTMVMSGGTNQAFGFVRVIGGSGAVTPVSNLMRPTNPTYPVTHNISVQSGDIIILAANVRTNSGVQHTFAASNMTLLWEDLFTSNSWALAYIAVATSTGTFSTTLTSSNHYQQWVDGYIVLRPTP